MTSTETTPIGLAFSGGGIRSAAFCSGVLRRLLKRKVKIDYLSCFQGEVTLARPSLIGSTEKRTEKANSTKTLGNGIADSSDI